MANISETLTLFINLSRAYIKISRRFDSRLGQGIGFSDFIILYYLSESLEEKMRRIDLADKVGLTASGITRLLLPMEKIGLIKREASEHDGRVSYVKLAPGGKRILTDTLEKAELIAEEILPHIKAGKIGAASDIFATIF